MLCVIRHVSYLYCRVFSKTDGIMRVFIERRFSGYRFLRVPALAILVVSVGRRCLCNLVSRQRSHASVFLRRIMPILVQRHILRFRQVHCSINRTVGYFNLVLIRNAVFVLIHSEIRHVFGCHIQASHLRDVFRLQLCIPAYHLSVLRPVLEGVAFLCFCQGARRCPGCWVHTIRVVGCCSMVFVIRHVIDCYCVFLFIIEIYSIRCRVTCNRQRFSQIRCSM